MKSANSLRLSQRSLRYGAFSQAPSHYGHDGHGLLAGHDCARRRGGSVRRPRRRPRRAGGGLPKSVKGSHVAAVASPVRQQHAVTAAATRAGGEQRRSAACRTSAPLGLCVFACRASMPVTPPRSQRWVHTALGQYVGTALGMGRSIGGSARLIPRVACPTASHGSRLVTAPPCSCVTYLQVGTAAATRRTLQWDSLGSKAASKVWLRRSLYSEEGPTVRQPLQ
jgi:hypothetical protein